MYDGQLGGEDEAVESLTEEVHMYLYLQVSLHFFHWALMEIEVYSSDEEAFNEGQCSGIPYAVVALCLFLFSWQASFRLLDNCSGPPLAFMHCPAVIHSQPLFIFTKNLPKNVKQLRAIAGVNVESFTKFVVCPLYHSIYNSEACLLTMGSTRG